MTPLEELASWASSLQASAVPAEHALLGRCRLLDTLGLIAAAAPEPAAQAVLRWARAYAGPGLATTIPGGERAVPAVAALVHGTLAHARDFDDTFPDTVVHPGSIVVATALSVGEQVDADFAATTTAIALGYEVAARLGQVAGRAFHAHGFHATGIVGPIAAAATAGRLLALGAEPMADALALATSMSGGLMAFLADGAWSKWLHTGWSAHGGIVAAELAAQGFRGPRHAFDDSSGLYGAFLGREARDLAPLTHDLGRTWLGAAAQPKAYPCAHVIAPYLDAALSLRAEGLGAGEVASVRCALAPWAMPIVAEPRAAKLAPRTDLDAIASLPFMLAAALCDGKVDLDTLRPETLRRDDIRNLAASITCEADEGLGTGFDGYLTVQPKAGASLRRAVALDAVNADRIRHKFRANAGRLYTEAQARALEAALFDGEPSCREIVRLAGCAEPCAGAPS